MLRAFTAYNEIYATGEIKGGKEGRDADGVGCAPLSTPQRSCSS